MKLTIFVGCLFFSPQKQSNVHDIYWNTLDTNFYKELNGKIAELKYFEIQLYYVTVIVPEMYSYKVLLKKKIIIIGVKIFKDIN